MKYKNRSQAKRKYKHILLVTAATFSLGMSTVSTFGNLTSVYAAETSTKSFQWVGNTIKVLDTANGNTANIEAVAGRLVGENYFKLVESGNLTFDDYMNTSRDLTLSAIAMIPYGGTFISSLLGMAWPSSGLSQMDQLINAVGPLIDQKISEYNLNTLKPKYKVLMGHVKALEDFINDAPRNVQTNVQYSPTPDGYYVTQETVRNKAENLLTEFDQVLAAAKVSGQEEASLPIYTLIATAHLQFLKFMSDNALHHPRIQYYNPNNVKGSEDAVGRLYADNLKSIAAEHLKYISKTSMSGEQKMINTMTKIKGAKQDDILNYMVNMNSINVANQGGTNQGINALHGTNAAETYATLYTNRSKYIRDTKENMAFNAIYGYLNEVSGTITVPLTTLTTDLGTSSINTSGLTLTPGSTIRNDGAKAVVYTGVTGLKLNHNYTLSVTLKSVNSKGPNGSQPVVLDYAGKQKKEFDIGGGVQQTIELPFTTYYENVTGINSCVGINSKAGDSVLITKIEIKER